MVKSCPIPIVMAGGPKSTDIFTNIQRALEAGAPSGHRPEHLPVA